MDTLNRLHGRRAVLAGAAGLGIAAIAGGSLAVAQATPDASDGTTTGTDTTTSDTTTDTTDRTAEAAARYDDFVTKLSSNLSIGDSTTVDTAIRGALTAMVDERLAAGAISADDATAAKEEIASSPSPVFGLFGGAHGGRGGDRPGFGGRGGPGNDRNPDAGSSDEDTDTTDTGTIDATPAAAV